MHCIIMRIYYFAAGGSLLNVFRTKIMHCFYRNNAANFAHSHSTRPHWYILAAGTKQFWYKIGDSEGYSKVGDLIICPPGFTLYRHSPEPLEFLSISFEWHYDLEHSGITDPIHPIFGNITIRDRPRYISTLKNYKEMVPGSTTFQVLKSYYTHLLDDLLFTCLLEKQYYQKKKTNDQTIIDAIRFLDERAKESISLKSVADRASLSQAQFCRRFQAAVGLSPMQYLSDIRLRKAESMLLETSLSIDHISNECGYQNGFYLSRVFTKKYGISPSKYRDMYRI